MAYVMENTFEISLSPKMNERATHVRTGKIEHINNPLPILKSLFTKTPTNSTKNFANQNFIIIDQPSSASKLNNSLLSFTFSAVLTRLLYKMTSL